jgi:hypothetical protein
MILPWERQPGDTDRSYAAFCAYRDMGPARSLDKLGDRWRSRTKGGNTGATTHLEVWSRDGRWVARARAWDNFKAEEARRVELEAAQAAEVEASEGRRRLIRADAWRNYALMQAAVRSALVTDEGGRGRSARRTCGAWTWRRSG